MMQPSESTRPGFGNFQFRRTLQANILIAITALLIVTVFVIVGYTYQQNSTAVLDLSEDLINQVTATVIERTTNYLAPAALVAQLSSDIPDIADQPLIDNPKLENYGAEILHIYPQLAGFFIGNEQGDFLFAKRFPDNVIGIQELDRSVEPPLRTWTYYDSDGNSEVELTENPAYDPRQRPWYIGAQATQGQFWTDIYIFFTDQEPGITAAYPIFAADGQITSIIGIDVALNELSSFLETQEVGQNGVAFIVNADGTIVAYPNILLARPEGETFRPVDISEIDVPWVRAAYEEYVQSGQSRFTVTSDNVRYIASFTPFPEDFSRDWQIGIVVPEEDFVGTIRQTNRVSLLISLVILILAIITAIFVSRGISRPIVQLTEETKKIENFDLDGRLQVESPIREVYLLGEAIATMKTSLRTFKKYVPAELVRQLIDSGEEAQLGGTQKELTIFFSDIAGFTAITEGAEPEQLLLQLSEYLGELATIILQQQGTVDKYMGDGLLAFWGAPASNPDHAYLACRAALLCSVKVDELNQRWLDEGRIAFPTRFGIHTGDTLVGNMGSPQRMDYTVLGDSVNLANRLEAINEVYGTKILVGDATREQVADRFHFRPLDIVTVKGKRRGIRLYELVGEVGATPPEKIELCQQFAAGFEAYLAQEWGEALHIFQSLAPKNPTDAATRIYLNRCIKLQGEPPGPDWNPIIHLG